VREKGDRRERGVCIKEREQREMQERGGGGRGGGEVEPNIPFRSLTLHPKLCC
jgi:hypothetical protein